MDELVFIGISGGLWKTTPVSETPQITLSSWRVMECERGRRHFIGYNETEGEGRVSSTIQTFDKETMRGVTRSGRVYQLIGDPGFNGDAMYVWERFMRINSIEAPRDVTSECV